MKNTIIVALAILLISLGASCAEESESLDELIARIADVPDGESGLSKSEQAYIAKLLEHENEVVSRLVELLSHSDLNVAEIAAAALGDCTRIDPKYLPQIITGLDRNIGWLPRSLGRIESDLAAQEAVNRYLLSSSSPHNQEAYAVELQGGRAIPFIIEAASKDGGKNPHVYYLLGHVLGEMECAERTHAASSLLVLLKDKNTSFDLLGGILTLVSKLGKAGRSLEGDLLGLREARPELRESVDSALIGIGSAHSGRIFAAMLRQKPDKMLLSDIAEAGDSAETAGPQLAELLDHSNWEFRLGAARTIGFIGYHGADAKLLNLVNDPTDVRLNLVAAESLGRLKSKDALKTLNEAAKEHWHPAVRNAAKTAAGKIESDSNYELKYHKDNFSLEYYDYQNMGIELPEDYRMAAIIDPSSLSALLAEHPEQVEKLSYWSEIVSYGASDEKEQQAEKGDDAIIVVNEGNMVEHRRKISVRPEVGIRVPHGWLLGADRGEWGGELVFKGEGTEHYRILNENINGIFKLGERIIAVTGLAHLTLNDGIVYELKVVDGKWRAERWRALPGAPQSSGKLKSGEIMVVTYGGGAVVLSETGQMRMADETPKPERTTE